MGYSEDEVKDLVAEAIRKGCHFALLFSRAPDFRRNISNTLRFCAERLPTLERRLLSVTPRGADTPIDGRPDLCVGVGDVLNYELSVTFYPPENKEYPLIYSDVYVTDEKTGNTGENRLSITPPSQEQWEGTTDSVVISRQVQYTVTARDLELGRVDNQAQLSFRFRPQQRKTANDAVVDARVSSTVRTSVDYRYESAVADMALPAVLVDLIPTDYTYYAQGDEASSQPHARSMYWDAANDGYWTLLDDGAWTGGGLRVAAGETFTMPDASVTLTATWTFTRAPDIELEKDGRIISMPASGQEGEQADYIAGYTISIHNTGGEPLRRFTIRDDTLPEDLSALQLFVGGDAVPPYDGVWSGDTLTIRLADPLQPDETLTLSYSCRRTGTLGYKTQLTDRSMADVTAAGAQTGVEVWKECDLNLQTTLQKAILLTPADMIIYAGGSTEGAGVVRGTNLPETGFFVTLPLEAETALRAELNTQEQSDLTPYLTFTDIDHNEWKLVWFHDDHPKVYGRFLYLLRPKDDPLDQTRFELQFYDPVKGTNVRQSDFQITDALQQEYKMTIFPGDRPASHPRGVLRVGDKELGSYALDVIPGTLFVRGTTKHLQVNDIELGSADFTGGMVVNCLEQDGVTYCINETMLSADRDNVKLLVDHIVGSVYGVTLQKMADDVIADIRAEAKDPLQYQYRYLDLVDTSMGNAWVTVNKPVEIVWRYPDGADREDDFTIIHYKDLDRNYNLSDLERLELGKDYTLEVFTTRALGESTDQITYHRLERGEKGLTFSTKSFSPYVLVWEGKPSSPPDSGSIPVPPTQPVQPAQPVRPARTERSGLDLHRTWAQTKRQLLASSCRFVCSRPGTEYKQKSEPPSGRRNPKQKVILSDDLLFCEGWFKPVF